MGNGWIKAKAAGAAVAALLTACGCGQVDSASQLQTAIAAAENHKWDDAHRYSARALAANEENVQAAVLKGISLHYLGRGSEALETLNTAAEQNPDQFLVQLVYGWILSEQNRCADALVPLERAHSQRPHHPDVLALLGRCTLEQNVARGVAYLEALQRFPAFNKRPEIYNALGIMHLRAGRVDEAMESFLTALDRSPASPVVMQNVAVVYDQYYRDAAQALRFYRYAVTASQAAGDRERAALIQKRLRDMARERSLSGTPAGGR